MLEVSRGLTKRERVRERERGWEGRGGGYVSENEEGEEEGEKNIQSRTLSCNLSSRLTLGVIADWIKTVISTRIGRVRRACSLYPYQRWPYDRDRTFSTLDSDANPELRRKEAVVVNRYPARNSAFVRRARTRNQRSM